MKKNLLVFPVLAGLLTACGGGSEKKEESLTLGYNLSQPVKRYALPPDLEEISGLSYFKENQLLCVQDEKAVAYVFDLQKEQVTDSSVFGGYGDYEGVELVGEDIFALKSNGDLFRFKPFSKEIARIPTGVPGKIEVEGLGYDPQTKRLLLAVKEGIRKDQKVVYMYDLATKVFWNGLTIKGDVLKQAGVDAAKFRPSGIAVHPKTGDFYFLSANERLLLVMNRKGAITAKATLDSKLFRQPEGICFAPDGTLYIASEGDGQAGYILSFAKQP
ncbi:SdiA-regulated domain-containing protein [Larkinella soli]|uniref:SdiA-regulated domain-containing protein n=1 Tax=Larkinella soli TaxID=1770527 RepID=UPI000FFCA975|nr:SdiA-regulated domain-containing protein [Larkinella soli]